MSAGTTLPSIFRASSKIAGAGVTASTEIFVTSPFLLQPQIPSEIRGLLCIWMCACHVQTPTSTHTLAGKAPWPCLCSQSSHTCGVAYLPEEAPKQPASADPGNMTGTPWPRECMVPWAQEDTAFRQAYHLSTQMPYPKRRDTLEDSQKGVLQDFRPWKDRWWPGSDTVLIRFRDVRFKLYHTPKTLM